MFELNGLTALVTGATGGLGGAMARALHAQGATVAISGTRREALEALAGELGERVHVLPCNLAEKAEVEALVPAAESAMGQLDILVNNAGVTKDGLFMRMKDDDWDSVLAINLTSAFRLSRAALKGMMKRRFGRIIGITSGTKSSALEARQSTVEYPSQALRRTGKICQVSPNQSARTSPKRSSRHSTVGLQVSGF